MAAPSNEYGIHLQGSIIRSSGLKSGQDKLIEAMKDDREGVIDAVKDLYMRRLDRDGDGVTKEGPLRGLKNGIQLGENIVRNKPELAELYIIASEALSDVENELSITATAPPKPPETPEAPQAAEGTSVTSDGDIITVKPADGAGLLLDYGFDDDWMTHDDKYGFTLKTSSGSYKNAMKLDDFGANEAIEILKNNQAAIQFEMGKILTERIEKGDNNERDSVHLEDLERVLSPLAKELESDSGRARELIDSMTVIALRDVAENLKFSGRDAFIEKLDSGAIENATIILENVGLNTQTLTQTSEEKLAAEQRLQDMGLAPAELAKDELARLVSGGDLKAMDNAGNPDSAFHAATAERSEEYGDQRDHYFEHGRFYGDVSETVAKMVALDAVLIQRDDAAQMSTPVENFDTLTLAEAQASPAYVKIMNDFSQHDPASERVAKATVQTVSVTGNISQTLNSAVEVQRTAPADNTTDIQTVQLLLSAANAGGYAPLKSEMGAIQPNGRALEISKIDGIRGWRTNGTLAATLGKDINDLGSSKAELAALQEKISSDPALQNAIQSGLPQALQDITDPTMRANMTHALNNFIQTNTEANAAPVALGRQFSEVASIDLSSSDRVLDVDVLEEAQETIERLRAVGSDTIPEGGILTTVSTNLFDGKTPMLIREINGELVVTQLNEDNFKGVMARNFLVDPKVEGELREKADRGDTSVEYGGIRVLVNPATARPDFMQISIDAGRDDDFNSTFIRNDDSGGGTVVETDELADAVNRFDGHHNDPGAAIRYRFDLPAKYNAEALGKQLDTLEHHLRGDKNDGLSVQFSGAGAESIAEINYGNGKKIELPKPLYDAIMAAADTKDAPAVEITAQPGTPPMG